MPAAARQIETPRIAVCACACTLGKRGGNRVVVTVVILAPEDTDFKTDSYCQPGSYCKTFS